MKWTVYEIEGDMHVAPSDEAGVLQSPHKLSLDCECHPKLNDGLIVHEVIQ